MVGFLLPKNRTNKRRAEMDTETRIRELKSVEENVLPKGDKGDPGDKGGSGKP